MDTEWQGRGVARLGSALALGLALSVGTASAEIKEYQIRRMLMLKTECGVSGLDSAKVSQGPATSPPRANPYTDRFQATCENVAHYPDGVEIVCPDTEDEQDCHLVTRRREFPHLNSFQR